MVDTKFFKDKRLMFYDTLFWAPIIAIILLSFNAYDYGVWEFIPVDSFSLFFAYFLVSVFIFLGLFMWLRLLYFTFKRRNWGWLVFGLFIPGILVFIYYPFVIRKAIKKGKGDEMKKDNRHGFFYR